MRIPSLFLRASLHVLCVLPVFLAAPGSSQSQPTQPDREAFTITRWQLDLRIAPADGTLAANGTLTLRNDSLVPQSQAVLQISSTLRWNSITIGGTPAEFKRSELRSDFDHTGSLSEAVIALPHAVAPQGTIEMEVDYAGTIPLDARRLTETSSGRIPLAVAEASDWDRISNEYTIVRGAGYVAWYPIALEPDSLAWAQRFFEHLGAWRQRHAASRLSIDVCVNALVPAGFTVIASGKPRPAAASSSGRSKCVGFDFDLANDRVPVLAAALFGVAEREHATAYYLGSRPTALDVLAAFETAEQTLAAWSPAVFTPREKSAMVQLPGAHIAAFESGPFLTTPFDASDKLLLQTNAARQIAHASFASPRLWIDEGVAQFAQVLIHEHAAGRKAALAFMNTRTPILAQVEDSLLQSDDELRGDPLVLSRNDVLTRLKGMFVWSMLRDMAGDAALQRALAAYRAADDKEPSYIQRLLEHESQVGGKRVDLEWFFDDWIYRDRGLPAFKIAEVKVRPTLRNSFTVEATIENSGDAGAEVPVAVTTSAGETEQRVLVPAGQKVTAHITVSAQPTSVMVNDGSVPEADRSDNTWKNEKK
ncbi:MAG: hypothetical protein HYX28_10260 [Candidatus Koribacter versatilis]|uniref:Peptidase M1, membrane alanine aminopeptidase n=1 Tax=Candidatus Korobacter versatilis TaxID=658062 RepID=A0A932ERR7_9BACT|nr:hypothetical protein [Candidatus Koribacter versatilis]